MKVLVLGSTGMIGTRIVAELRHRRHQVTCGIRLHDADTDTDADADAKTGPIDGVAVNPRDPASIRAAAAGHDAVVSALGRGSLADTRIVAEAALPLLEGLAASGCPRLVVVGGAGSLRDSDGQRVIDGPSFPEAWKPGSRAQIDAVETYQGYTGPVEWTYLSPSDLIEPGERTGRVVLGDDDLLRDDHGRSYVSAEDFAVAVVDELETPAHPRRRFTVRSADAPAQLAPPPDQR